MVSLSAVCVATLEEQKIIKCTDNRLGIRIILSYQQCYKLAS